MKKRAIGIDISARNIEAVQLIKNGNSYTVEKSMSTPLRRETDSVERILASLTTQFGFDHKAMAAINTPGESTFFHDIDLVCCFHHVACLLYYEVQLP